MCGQNGLCKTNFTGKEKEEIHFSETRICCRTDVNIYTFRKLLTIIVSFAEQTEFVKHTEEKARNINIR